MAKLNKKFKIKNNLGYSMMEVVVAIGSVGVIGIMIATVLQSSAFLSKRTQNRESVMANLVRLGYELKMNFDQAFTIDSVAGNINGNSATFNNGFFRNDFDSDTIGVVPAGTIDVHTIALFVAETSRSSATGAPATIRSRFTGVGVYFQHPTPVTSGAVYITQIPANAGAQNIDPIGNSSIFDGLVALEVRRADVFPDPIGGTNRITRAQIYVAGRYFSGSDFTRARWCHPDRMGGASCQNLLPYSDVERVYDFTFRNNLLPNTILGNITRTAGQSGIGIFGNLHFFKSVPHRTNSTF